MTIDSTVMVIALMIMRAGAMHNAKIAIYCPQGSGTLRQQLFIMQGIVWYCMVFHGIA